MVRKHHKDTLLPVSRNWVLRDLICSREDPKKICTKFCSLMSFNVVYRSGGVIASCLSKRAVQGVIKGLSSSASFESRRQSCCSGVKSLRGQEIGYRVLQGLGGFGGQGFSRGLGIGSASGVHSSLVREDKVDSMDQKLAIITGVARPNGIGRHLVLAFLKQGYNVVGVDVQELIQEEELRVACFQFVQADISNPKEANRAILQSVQSYGGEIHVLINNAAKLPHSGTNDPMKEFADTVAVNLNGAYYMSQCAQPFMPKGRSSIINMSSTRAHQSEPDTAGYSASKAGLCGLTHSQAITLAGKVRVNAVLPGWINTDERGAAALRPEDHAWHPAGRVGVPQDVVEMCLFLCDGKRAGFITGQEFVIDGGVSKKMVYPE